MAASAILLGLMPSALMVILGGLVRGRLSENAWQGLDRLNFEVLFPALLFLSAAGRPIALADALVIGPAVVVILSAGLALGWTARRFGPERFLDFAGAWQCAWRFNTALGFVAVGTLATGDLGVMAVCAGVGVPLANLFAVGALSRGGGLGRAETVRRVVLNPFLLASVLGVAVGLSGTELPRVLVAPLELLAQASIPVALISLGATMRWGALAQLDRFSGIICATRLVALPALALGIGLAFGLGPAVAASLVVFAALPASSAAHVLAGGFGADRRLAATLSAQTTLLSAASLPVWIAAADWVF